MAHQARLHMVRDWSLHERKWSRGGCDSLDKQDVLCMPVHDGYTMSTTGMKTKRTLMGGVYAQAAEAALGTNSASWILERGWVAGRRAEYISISMIQSYTLPLLVFNLRARLLRILHYATLSKRPKLAGARLTLSPCLRYSKHTQLYQGYLRTPSARPA